MVDKIIIYEHPLNEKVRTMLRLEHLFTQAGHYLNGRSRWDTRVMIATLMDILDFLSRSDLRTELLKEIERSITNLRQLMQIPEVDEARLSTILRALEHLASNLHSVKQQLGQELRNDPFLTQIRQRCTIPGGSCDFDLPSYHHWLNQAPEKRIADQKRWFAQLDPARQAIELILKMLRNSSEFRSGQSDSGSYEQALDSSTAYQLIRLALPASASYYAELSGSKHRFSVRFLRPGGEKVDTPVEFKYSTCTI